MNEYIFNESANQPLKCPVEKIPNNYKDSLAYCKMRNQKLQEINKMQEYKRQKIGRLEEGFSLYFNGANDKRKEQTTAIAPRKSKTCEERGKTLTDRSKSGIDRPKWGSATKIGFLTERGDKMFVRPNNYYSDDFDEVNEIIDETVDEIEEANNFMGMSMELSMNEIRYLKESLIMNNNKISDEPNNQEYNKVKRKEVNVGVNQDLKMKEETFKTNGKELSTNSNNNFKETTVKIKEEQRNTENKTCQENIFEDKCKSESIDDKNAKILTLELKVEDEMIDVNEADNDQRLKAIIDRVLKMNFNQQQRLLSSLDKIETVYENGNEIEISLAIESNWGHPSRVGLTEIEFWDARKKRIDVRNVIPVGHVEGGERIENLINDRKDTSKGKHMWSTEFNSKRNVIINFILTAPSVRDVKYVAVWNYNKSIDSLSIGVQRISLKHSEEVLCVGIVDKALGNAVFNPPTIIELGNPQDSLRMHENEKNNYEDDLTDDDDECLLDKFKNAQNFTFRIDEKGSEMMSDKLKEKAEEVSERSNLLLEEGGALGNNSSSRMGSAKYGRRSELDAYEGKDKLKELVAEFEVKAFDKQKPESLEKSWSSLTFFNKSQAGRLSLDHTGDILDKYIDNIRRDHGESDGIDCEEEFVIPELPRGRDLCLNIRTTWGDPHYVGLTGIEMFASTGDRVVVASIRANPPDINILPGYGNDPRVVRNLLDGVNKTHDDVHMWLAPFTANRNHMVMIEFDSEVDLALLRIWNYNKSRIHSSRGAREVEITLDGVMIFKGEIARAFQSNEIEECGEVILFTSDDQILDKIGQNDLEFVDSNDNENGFHSKELLDSLVMRPPTAKETSPKQKKEVNQKPEKNKANNIANRPFTSTRPVRFASEKKLAVVKLIFSETWGDKYYIGLNGIEFVGSDGNAIAVDKEHVSTNIEALQDDVRKIENLFDDANLVTDDEHMWLAPFDCNQEQFITVALESFSSLSAIRIWNYNKSLEDSYRGVKNLHVWIDDKRISPEAGYLLRRAPGHVQYDFSQEIQLGARSAVTEDLCQYHHLPCGFVYQFNIFSAWSDQYYVGLNGIEFFDHARRSIPINPQQVYAYPDSVNSLTPKNQRNFSNLDVRTPDKLIDGVNNTYDAKHMWLAPILPGCLNRIFFVFDHQICVSMIKIWNYSKTPARGVKDFSILVDDLLIYSGTLSCSQSANLSRGILPNMNDTIAPTNLHKTVLFDRNNSSLVTQEKLYLLEHNVPNGQDVILINDNDINSAQCANQKFRPVTSVKGRGMTK